MFFTLTFAEPFDQERLLDSFERLVWSRESLRVRFVEVGSGYQWIPFSDADVRRCLTYQRRQFEQPVARETLFREYLPTNMALPLRVARLDEQRLVLVVNHVFGNGLTTLYWLEEWLRLYSGETQPSESSEDASPKGFLSSVIEAISGLMWLSCYLIQFVSRAGRRAGQETVDLSRGIRPAPHQKGYAVKTYSMSEQETEAAIKRSRSLGLSVTEAICAAMAEALLESQPDKSRVCISVPTDLGAFIPKFSRERPGNYTGSLILQIFRERETKAQVRSGFQWVRRRVNYWLPRLLGTFAGSERKLRASFAQKAALPIPDRAPFENFSCAVSGVGVIRERLIRKYLHSISAHTRTQTIFVCAMTINGRMTLEVSVPRDLFDAEEAFRVTDAAAALLSGKAIGASAAANRTTAQA